MPLFDTATSSVNPISVNDASEIHPTLGNASTPYADAPWDWSQGPRPECSLTEPSAKPDWTSTQDTDGPKPRYGDMRGIPGVPVGRSNSASSSRKPSQAESKSRLGSLYSSRASKDSKPSVANTNQSSISKSALATASLGLLSGMGTDDTARYFTTGIGSNAISPSGYGSSVGAGSLSAVNPTWGYGTAVSLSQRDDSAKPSYTGETSKYPLTDSVYARHAETVGSGYEY